MGPKLSSYLKYANWERKMGNLVNSRAIYQKVLQVLGEQAYKSEFFISFADLEIEAGEIQRVRKIFQMALDHVPKHAAEELFKKYVAFEKKFGNKDSIDYVILNKRRFEYNKDLQENELNYDIWFDYCKLEEQNGHVEMIRETYERAISSKPIISDKTLWRRYIYLFIKYALFEELKQNNFERVREIYQLCLDQVIPNHLFTFGKIWILYAEFEIRRRNFQKAKLILSRGVEQTYKKNVFKKYVDILISFKEIDNCRKLYEQWLNFYPEDTDSWINFAILEQKLLEYSRVRSILDLAISQKSLNFPERIWKFFIDFEINQESYEKVRELYLRLLEKTKHFRIWISFAQFECSIRKPENARKVFEDANRYLKTNAIYERATEEYVILLGVWEEFEEEFGNEEQKRIVKEKQPKKVKKKRPFFNLEGVEIGQEEYYDYLFPEDDKQSGNRNLLRIASRWKKHQLEQIIE